MSRKIVLASILSMCLTSSFSDAQSSAQQITVEKVKGNKAVIEFSGGSLSPGKTYSIGGTSSEGGHSGGGGDRKYVVGGNFDLQFLDASSSTLPGSSSKNNLIGINTRLGWNLERYEVGGILGYTNTERSTSSFSAFKGGGFFDFNLTPNRPGETSIYGASGEVAYTSITSTAGGSLIGVYASGFAKWFVFGPSTALRVDAGYQYDSGTNTGSTTTTQGFSVRGGLASYF